MDEIIANNIGLVYKQLHRFNLADDDEALSRAMEALWVAAKTFDKQKNIHFSTYATACIYNALVMYTRFLNKKRQITTKCYFEPAHGAENFRLLDTLATDETPESSYIRKEHIAMCYKAINKVLNDSATQSQRDVISIWMDSDCKISQAAIAKQVGMSQAQVSRIIKVFKYQVKKELEENV